jgi:monoamine oxidase
MVRKNSKVTAIHQDGKGVTVTYKDTKSGAVMKAAADYCLCTIPLPVLAQIEMNVSPELDAAIRAVPYTTSVKVGLEFKRRFWEQDDQIYGGITYTDLPNSQISYPSTRYGDKGPGVLLGCYVGGPAGYELTAMTPQQRVKRDGMGRTDPPTISRRIHERRFGGMAPRALHAGLFWSVVRTDAGRTLHEPVQI